MDHAPTGSWDNLDFNSYMTGSGHLTSLFLIVLTGQWKISFPTGLTLTCNVNVLFPAQSREKWKAPPTTMLKKLYLALDGGLIRWKAGGDSEVADREPCMWEKWKAKGSYLFLLLAAPEEWAEWHKLRVESPDRACHCGSWLSPDINHKGDQIWVLW